MHCVLYFQRLVNFAEGKLNFPIILKSRKNGKQFEGVERLMNWMNESHRIEVDVEPLARRYFTLKKKINRGLTH